MKNEPLDALQDDIPPEHRLPTVIPLSPAAIAALEELLENPGAPSEGLRRLFARRAAEWVDG
jgi:uncharacterized protein (DUF1778 family)